MAATPSTMLELGTKAPGFDLPNLNKHTGAPWITEQDYHHQPLLVAFICNHCPYVVLIIEKFAQLALKWQQQGINVVAISSNDVEHYPADAPEKMTELAKQHQFEFPYLYDQSQEVAKAYRAACTPDFFLFDCNHQLVYRGQFDQARPGNGKIVTGEDLDNAIQALMSGEPISEPQIPSVGCNIKWKAGNQPDYF